MFVSNHALGRCDGTLLAGVDGDGLADLLSGGACCQHAYGCYLFQRQKDGSFAARQRIKLDYSMGQFEHFEFPGGGLQAKVAVTDWNGDGIPDLLVGGNTRVLGVAYGALAGKKTVTRAGLAEGKNSYPHDHQSAWPTGMGTGWRT